MKRMLRSPWGKAFLARLVGAYLAFALRTTRWTLDGVEHLAPHAGGAPAILAFWHECLPLVPALTILIQRLPGYQPARMHALVSQHFDGRLIGDLVRRFGIEPVHGSSSKGGATSVRTLLRLLARGDIVGITPDGPRGPRHKAEPGIALLAGLSGVPVLPCAARTTRRILLGSWDRMAIPLPFGRGVIVCGPTMTVAKADWSGALSGIEAAMNGVLERADRLCQA